MIRNKKCWLLKTGYIVVFMCKICLERNFAWTSVVQWLYSPSEREEIGFGSEFIYAKTGTKNHILKWPQVISHLIYNLFRVRSKGSISNEIVKKGTTKCQEKYSSVVSFITTLGAYWFKVFSIKNHQRYDYAQTIECDLFVE